MMAEHGGPCVGSDTSYCMHGGTCFKIPSVSTPTCMCSENYKGSRCEQLQLLSTSTNSGETGLIAAVVIIALLITVVLVVVIYYACQWRKKETQSQQSGEQYWRVKPRV